MELSDYQKAFNHSLKLLAISKRTVRQLYHKLVEKGFNSQAIQEAIESLQEKKLIDDEEFAKSYVSEKLATRPTGRVQLEQVLKRKGIASDLVRKVVGEIDENYEFNAALKLAQDKAEFLRNLDSIHRKKKVYDFLKRKGFRFSVCRDVIKQIK